ncbi:hypothetical protein [Ruminococcus champanellensis]|uniref:TIR domain-containing protein n=1 Tax=Ruminococcus champanellensis (strain DSM 18848 / JCM 17042 / KCTC 15320 / 18P13) TaxID=213810 RepID=D4LC54_RUMC1|nr:hypothetical protein [Ruminococcus champanellensis]CBL17199.1 hypothetical protein RUM_10380 [Ruminococcus champanellensis 18P13 = JCM 17042]
MFAKFNYSPSGAFYNSVINHFYTKGNELFAAHEKEVQDCLSDYISEDGVINGTDLKEHWFSISKKDIFISHSHKDINKVKAFAGWLYDCFGLEAFIDSCSWGYCDDLLNKIDKKYCYRPKTNTYDYQLRNYTTSHVHMMLSMALTEMIDNTECIIFFDTPQSINMADELKKIEKKSKKETTLSPWIYHELSMTTMLRERQPRKAISESTHFQHSSTRDSIAIEYDVSKALSGMTTLSDIQLQQWNENWSKRPIKVPEEALDELYKIVFPKGQ